MAGIINELADVLEQEKECYAGLETLADYTTMAVMNKNIEFLQQVVTTEEEFVGRLSLLEKKRESLMKDIAIVTGMKFQSLTVARIIEKIGSETEMGQRLTVLRGEIKEQLESLRRKSELNKQLLSDSLEIVDFSVNALRSARGYNSQPVSYARPGGAGMAGSQQSLFDQKK